MKRNTIVNCLLFCLLVTLVLNFGCGASRQNTDYGDDSVDIDDLIEEEDIAQSNQEEDQAEVLRLLGITPSEEEEQPQEMVVSMNEPEAQQEELEGDIRQLKNELLDKDREISQLRSELTEKEMKISDLESKVESQPVRTAPPKPTGAVSEPSTEFKVNYQNALDQYKAKKYREAINSFSQLLLSDPNNSLSDNCQYWLGESYFGLANFDQAIVEFEKVFSFPNSNKSDDSQLKLGICYIKLGDKSQAKAEFDRLLAMYPDSEYKKLAQRYIGRM